MSLDRIIRRDQILQKAYEIPGQSWPVELSWFFEEFRESRTHVEIGTYCGRSLFATCFGLDETAKIYAVDNESETPMGTEWTHGVRKLTFDRIEKESKQKVTYLSMNSIDAARWCYEKKISFDSVYIDADHNYAECLADIQAWSPLVKPGGLISGHDFWPAHIGVMDAVNEAFSGNHKVAPGTRIWYIKKV